MNNTNCLVTLPTSLMSALLKDLPDIEYRYKTVEEHKQGKEGKLKKRRPEMWDIRQVIMFQQTWGSTALGFGGMGGASMTTADVVVVEGPDASCCVYMGGHLAYTIKSPKPDFWRDVRAHCMVDVELKDKYENK